MNTKEIKNLIRSNKELIDILLYDHTSQKNIQWDVKNSLKYGKHITYEQLCSNQHFPIKYRYEKTSEEKRTRTKNKAEVFTPSWVCNQQNNLIDDAWFGYENAFNISEKNTWNTNVNKIKFIGNKTWEDYIKDTRLEITCGEAPYLVSRYETTSGTHIEIRDRIGMLDRKLRIAFENTTNYEEWYKKAVDSFKSIYGYDIQGENVYIARENLLITFIEYSIFYSTCKPSKDEIINIAKIISWNIWQMDGLKFIVPCYEENIYCKIMDWSTNQTCNFIDLLGKESIR